MEVPGLRSLTGQQQINQQQVQGQQTNKITTQVPTQQRIPISQQHLPLSQQVFVVPNQAPSVPIIHHNTQTIMQALLEMNIPPTQLNILLAQALVNLGQPINQRSVRYLRQRTQNLKDRSSKALESALILILEDLPVTDDNVRSLKQLINGKNLPQQLKNLQQEITELRKQLPDSPQKYSSEGKITVSTDGSKNVMAQQQVGIITTKEKLSELKKIETTATKLDELSQISKTEKKEQNIKDKIKEEQLLKNNNINNQKIGALSRINKYLDKEIQELTKKNITGELKEGQNMESKISNLSNEKREKKIFLTTQLSEDRVTKELDSDIIDKIRQENIESQNSPTKPLSSSEKVSNTLDFQLFTNELIKLNVLLQKIIENLILKKPSLFYAQINKLIYLFGDFERRISELRKIFQRLFPNIIDNIDDEDGLNIISKLSFLIDEEKQENKLKNIKNILENIANQIEKIGLHLHARTILSQSSNSLCIPIFLLNENKLIPAEVLIQEEKDSSPSGKTRIKISLSVQTENLGKVGADFSVLEKEIILNLKVTNKLSQGIINEKLELLVNKIKNTSYFLKSISCTIDSSQEYRNSLLIPPKREVKSLKRIEGIV